MSLRVIPVACLTDNYAYLVIAPNGEVAVVDPSEAAPISTALAQYLPGAELSEIWCTHHHLDHVGGVDRLVADSAAAHGGVSRLRVRGSTYDAAHDRIPCLTDAHADGDTFDFAGTSVRVVNIPGHTLGAIAFIAEGELFSGDTLFLGGCGRVFEGTMPMMAASMRILRALDPKTRVWCGHEYTASNLRFAASIEPDNDAIARALAEATSASSEGRATVPGTLEQELRVNPFLRFDLPAITGGLDPDASFAKLREAKNDFRG
jgi:hydroxyacylglutathione hydrolase